MKKARIGLPLPEQPQQQQDPQTHTAALAAPTAALGPVGHPAWNIRGVEEVRADVAEIIKEVDRTDINRIRPLVWDLLMCIVQLLGLRD